MPEAGPRRPTGVIGSGPAIGPGGRLPRWTLARRYALALGLILLLGVAKMVIAPGTVNVVSMIQPDRVVTPGLIIGAAPTDTELQELAADLQVDGVVNLGAPSVAEQATATSLHQAYLYLAVARGPPRPGLSCVLRPASCAATPSGAPGFTCTTTWTAAGP